MNKAEARAVTRKMPELIPSGKHPGIVDFYVHVASGLLSASSRAKSKNISSQQMIAYVQRGLPLEELEALQKTLDMPLEKLSTKLGISKATLHRRKSEGRLTQEESDRLVRFARLMGKAVEVFESEEAARQWLASPQFGLGGAVPLDYAETEVGAREVEELLGRIDTGVYS